MLRFPLILLVVALSSFVFLSAVSADPPAANKDSAIRSVAVQQAMRQAVYFMRSGKPGMAVEVLEAQVDHIKGNGDYLDQLERAYRSYVQELWLAGNEKEARRYLGRLCVLDPKAASDPILTGRKPATALAETKPAPAAPQVIIAPQASTATVAPLPSPTAPTPLVPAGNPNIFRGKPDDPFNQANQRFGSDDRSQARQMLASGEAEYVQRNFDEARKCFEQAHKADPQVFSGRAREYWAYCILYYVNNKVKHASMTPERLDEMRRFVDSAVAMSPEVGEASMKVIRAIDERRSSGGNTGGETIEVQHRPQTEQGWQVAETAHFRVLYRNESRSFIEKIARAAEKTRGDMFRKWFNHDGARWDEKCELFVHASAQDYSNATKAPLDAPGHASIRWDRTGVVSRRIDTHSEQNALLETLLPRETTHVVLAGMFGSSPLPRWADVGMAVLTESSGRVGEHRRNLAACHKEGTLFGVRELLQMADYPDKERIRAFYAQSVSLVEFLTSRRGPAVFAEFVRDGGRDGFEPALKRHYNWNLADLETQWAEHVQSETARLARAQ